MPNFILAYHPGKMPEDAPRRAPGCEIGWKAWVERLGGDVVNPGTPLGKSRTVSAGGVSQGWRPESADGSFCCECRQSMPLSRSPGHADLRIGTIEVAEIDADVAPDLATGLHHGRVQIDERGST